ncbi:unnamed protein product [Musa acuminata subsp. burmannicoides]
MSEDTSVCGTDFLRSRLHYPNNQPHHSSKSTVSVAATTTTSTDKNSEKKEVVAPIQEAPQPTPLLASVSSTALDTEKKRRGNVAVRPTPAPTLAYGLALPLCALCPPDNFLGVKFDLDTIGLLRFDLSIVEKKTEVS